MNEIRKTPVKGKTILSPSAARKAKERKIILDAYLKGYGLDDIKNYYAQENDGASVSRNYIQRVLKQAMAKWESDKATDIERHRAVELQKISRLEFEYWTAWHRSCEIQKAKSTIKNKDAEGGRMKVTTVRDDEKPGLGDAQYLRGIQWCIDTRCRILGIEVPVVQINNTQINNNDNRTANTTIVRRVVFKTRETTSIPQTFSEAIPE
jgi:hypothetical protein